ncbi:MAG: hypothetical protein WCD47_17480 [Candidatus Sulfotelmatobacter sp.]|jgi:hypothetical protein
MDRQKVKAQIDLLASLVEKARADKDDPVGMCQWTDVNGDNRCNNFSQFQCQQVSGTWTAGQRCP